MRSTWPWNKGGGVHIAEYASQQHDNKIHQLFKENVRKEAPTPITTKMSSVDRTLIHGIKKENKKKQTYVVQDWYKYIPYFFLHKNIPIFNLEPVNTKITVNFQAVTLKQPPPHTQPQILRVSVSKGGGGFTVFKHFLGWLVSMKRY